MKPGGSGFIDYLNPFRAYLGSFVVCLWKLWRRLGNVWSRLGALWHQEYYLKYPLNPHFQPINANQQNGPTCDSSEK